MQELLKQMEALQREYTSERQALSIQLLSVIQSQEVVTDVPAALSSSIPGIGGSITANTGSRMMFEQLSMLLMQGQQNLQQSQQLSLNQHLMHQQQQPTAVRLSSACYISLHVAYCLILFPGSGHGPASLYSSTTASTTSCHAFDAPRKWLP